MAVRLGTALRLGQEDEQRVHAFELQIRRRLWYCISLMDTHASFDRGTNPMIRWEDLGPPPLLLNDEEFSLHRTPQSSTPGFNEMSFFALMFRAMACHKKMLSMPNSAEYGWPAKLHLVLDFERSIKEEYFNVSQESTPLQRFAAQAAAGICTGMHMVLRRPPYKQQIETIPSSDDFNVLENATKVLKYELQLKAEEFAPWAWKNWVQWHALAIVLAELCTQSLGRDTDTIYAIALQNFDRYSRIIADNETGMLWRPISKLMRRAKQARDTTLRTSNFSNTSFHSREAERQVSDQSSVSNGTPDVHLSSTQTASNSELQSMHWTPDTDVDGILLCPIDQTMIDSDDSLLNWSMFVNEINLDYPQDLQDISAWDTAMYLEGQGHTEHG